MIPGYRRTLIKEGERSKVGGDVHAFIKVGFVHDADHVGVLCQIGEVAGGAERVSVIGLHNSTISADVYADVVLVDVQQLWIEPRVELHR